MDFTIAIPVHNGEKYLHEAIMSVLSQTRLPDEVLVFDDASTDGTADIAQSNEWNGKVKYIYNDMSTGWVDAFNRVVSLSKSEFLTILGCDDILSEDFLFHVEKSLEKFPSARFCYTGHYYINGMGLRHGASPEHHSTDAVFYSGKEYASRYLRSVFSGKHIHRFLGVAIDRSLLLNQCPLRRDAGLIADDDLFVRIGALTDVVGISQPLASIRIHELSVSSRLDSLALRLSEDYLFQVQNPQAHIHLKPEDIEIYHRLTARFIDELLLSALRVGKNEWLMKAISLRIAFDKEVPGFIDNSHSLQWQLLWKTVRNGKGLHIRGYLILIGYIRKLKNFKSR